MGQTNELETLKRKSSALNTILGVVVGTALSLTIVGGGFAGIAGAVNNYFNNVNYRIKDTLVQKKTDGLFTYTEVQKYDNGRTFVYRRNSIDFVKSTNYYDSNGDGLVDSVSRWENNSGKILSSDFVIYNRDKDLDKYPQIFAEADADFQAQMKRFE